MNSEKTMISLEELTIFFLKKWKTIMIIMITCIVLITGAVWLFFETKFVETDFLYHHYEKLVQEEEAYQYNSPIMKMDYNEVHKKYIDLFEISDIEKIKKYVLSEEIWEEFPGDISLNYLTELVSWQEADDGMIRIFVRYDVESEYDYVEFLVGKIKEHDEGIMLNTSEEFVEYDADVFNKQIEHTTLYRHYTEQMKISRVGYVQETAVTSAIIFSGVLGMILSVAIVLSQFIKNRQPGKEEKN